jgi:hypothetical protein
MEITFESGIGSFLIERHLNKDRGSTQLKIYNNQIIIIYLRKNQMIIEKILEKDMKKELTKEEVSKIHILFKNGFYRNICTKERGRTCTAYYDNYIKSMNKYLENLI